MRRVIKRVGLALGVGLAALASTGCQTVSTFHTARPIPAGTSEWALSGTAVARPGSEEVVVTPAVRWRRGIVDRVDLGINALMVDADFPEGRTVFALGGAADVNIMVIDLGLMAFSVDPMVSGTWFLDDGSFTGTAQLALIADVLSTPVFSLTAAIRPGWVYTMHGTDFGGGILRSGPITAATVGAKATFLGISLMPEVGVTYGLYADEPLYTAGVALMF